MQHSTNMPGQIPVLVQYHQLLARHRLPTPHDMWVNGCFCIFTLTYAAHWGK